MIRLLPEGFRALWRLCSAPHLLGSGGELTKLNVAFQFENSAVAGVHEERVELGDRIGSGGTSDIYDCGACGFADARDCVLKVSRTTSAESYESFTSERSALLVAAALGLVPECVAFGERVRSDSHAVARSAVKNSPWPVLLLRPRGMDLPAWVTSCVELAVASACQSGAAAAASEARIACADAVVLRVLAALEAAHTVGRIHCDVRPSNIVVANGAAALIDWGIAVKEGVAIKGRGVVAYADARIFTAGICARPHLDAVAALYTWLSISCGHNCEAPWNASAASVDSVFSSRSRFIEIKLSCDQERLSRVAQGVVTLVSYDSHSSLSALEVACGCIQPVR